MAPEDFPHRFGFTRPQETIVDKNAGELIANGLLQQRRRYARINAAAQSQDNFLGTDLRANFINGLVCITAHRPIPAATANGVHEIADDFLAARRVNDLGMKLQAEHPLPSMLD